MASFFSDFTSKIKYNGTNHGRLDLRDIIFFYFYNGWMGFSTVQEYFSGFKTMIEW